MKLGIRSQGIFFNLKKSLHKAYFFCLCLLQVNIQVFLATEVSASEVPNILKICLERNNFRGRHLETVLSSQAVFMWRHSIRLEIGRKEKNLQLTCINFFSKQLSALRTSMLSFLSLEHICRKIMWLKSSHNLELVERLAGSHLDKISWTEWRNRNAAWLLSTVQNGRNNVKFWASLWTNFIRKTCTLEAETSASG